MGSRLRRAAPLLRSMLRRKNVGMAEGLVDLVVVVAGLAAQSVVKPLASSELKWVTPEELITLEFPPANVPIQDRMRRYHRLG